MGTNGGLGKILVVDDEICLSEVLSDLFQQEGYEVEVAEERFEAARRALGFRPDLVFTNQNMPGGKGLDFAEDLLREGFETRLVLFSGMNLGGRGPPPRECLERGFCEFVTKPTTVGQIKAAVRRLIHDPEATNLKIARFAELTRTFLHRLENPDKGAG